MHNNTKSNKTIYTADDLAINGTAPAFSEPLHVGSPHLPPRETFDTYVDRIYDTRWLTNNGPLVGELEQRLAQHLGVRNCVAICNGTIALEIAIRALELKGEVIVPSFTFIATAHALHWQEITPVFADVDPSTHTLDPDATRKMITPRTSGIIGVHLWGRPCAIEPLQALADEHGLALMFDAAHAFGSSYNGQRVGSFGECEVFSFHATKFFNSFEGGAIATNNDSLAEKIRLMRNFGFAGWDNVIHPGTNGKMTEICAAMGLANLESLDRNLEANRLCHEKYRALLQGLPGVKVLDVGDNTNRQYVVLEIEDTATISRDELLEALKAENVLARKYFWPGCHRMLPYRALYPHAGLMLPQTEALADRVLVLPTGRNLPEGAIETIVQVIQVAMADSGFGMTPHGTHAVNSDKYRNGRLLV